MMCTVLVSIVGQSINVAINPAQWDSVQAATYDKVHDSAPVQPSWLFNDTLNNRVDKQKGQVNNRLNNISWWWKKSTSSEQLKNVEKSEKNNWFEYHREDPHTHIDVEFETPNVQDYVPFTTLQYNLKEKFCKYELPIDNADPPSVPTIQWALEHCLITVSGSYKVYPNDYLTHKTMRIIAERAGFKVKMEYASDQIVTNSQLLSFMNALQQHHRISDIPSILVGEKVTRWEYLKILYLLFNDTTIVPQDTNLRPVQITTSVANTLTDTAVSKGKELIGEYMNDTSQDIPDVLKNKVLDFVQSNLADKSLPTQEKSLPTKDENETIWLNTDALQGTRVRIQQWLGRSDI